MWGSDITLGLFGPQTKHRDCDFLIPKPPVRTSPCRNLPSRCNICFYGTPYFIYSGILVNQKRQEYDFIIYMSIVGFLGWLNARMTILPNLDGLDTNRKDGIHYLVLEGFCFRAKENSILPIYPGYCEFENSLALDIEDLGKGSISLFMMMYRSSVNPDSNDVIINLLVDWNSRHTGYWWTKSSRRYEKKNGLGFTDVDHGRSLERIWNH